MTLAAGSEMAVLPPQSTSLDEVGSGLPPQSPRLASAQAPAPLKWTRDEFRELARLGFFQGRRTFLLAGEIFEMASQGNWHVVVLELCLRSLRPAFPEADYWLRGQAPIDLPDGSSDPEPDIAIIKGDPKSFATHPSTALLIVEVADSSLKADRRKANAYASAGVQEYWIVDIAGRQVEVYRGPIPDPREPFGHRYDQFEVLRPGASISPLAAPGSTIAIADLLPNQPIPNPDA